MKQPRVVSALSVMTVESGYIVETRGAGHQDCMKIGHDQARLLWLTLAASMKDVTPAQLASEIAEAVEVEPPCDVPFR